MKWFQVDSDALDDPKLQIIYARLGHTGISGLFHLWCFVARHGSRPGWSLDSAGRPIAKSFLLQSSRLSLKKFAALLEICFETAHLDRKKWESQGVLVFRAMALRADTYTQRRERAGANNVRTRFEHASKFVPLQDKTIQDIRTNTARRAAPSRARARKPKSTKSAPTAYRSVLGVARAIVAAKPGAEFTSLKDELKSACASHGIPYDAEVIGKALESAMAIRAKARRA